jgi:hypothetical protein
LLINLSFADEYTEDFESATHNATTFTSNGFTFNLTNQLTIYNSGNFYEGYNNSRLMISTDNNGGNSGYNGSITISSGKFYLKSMYLYPGDPDKVTGNVTIELWSSGAMITSLTKGFNQNPNDFELWDILSPNNHIPIDEIKFSFTGSVTNLRIDHFTFEIAPEINILGNGTSISDGDATPDLNDHTDFGSANIAAETVVRTFTIQNLGTKVLSLTGAPYISIGGANAADFSVTAQPTSTIAALTGSTTFNITFDPSAEGIRSATISIANDDGNENPYNFSIQGTGTVTPEIDVSGNGNSIANGDGTPSITDNTDFGSIPTTGGTTEKIFTISNSGNGALTLSGNPIISIGGANAADFTVTSQASSPVAANGGSTNFTIQFDPSVSALRSATVTIQNDDSDESPYTFAIQGTGVDVAVPTLSSVAASNITEGTASSGGNITSDGGAAVTARGVVWSKTNTPTLSSNEAGSTSDGTGTGAFTSDLSALEAGTTYFVRAYASNAAGTGYSDEISFSTLNLDISVSQVTKISDTEYSLSCTIDNQIGTNITAKGIVWSTSQNPTTSSNSGIEMAVTGGNADYTLNASNLSVGPGYYVRAYITTANGTFYSDQIHFGVVPTLPEWGLIALLCGLLLSGAWTIYRRF